MRLRISCPAAFRYAFGGENTELFRKEALIRNAQPESLDDLLRVTAPHERLFQIAFVISALALAGLLLWMVLAD